MFVDSPECHGVDLFKVIVGAVVEGEQRPGILVGIVERGGVLRGLDTLPGREAVPVVADIAQDAAALFHADCPEVVGVEVPAERARDDNLLSGEGELARVADDDTALEERRAAAVGEYAVGIAALGEVAGVGQNRVDGTCLETGLGAVGGRQDDFKAAVGFADEVLLRLPEQFRVFDGQRAALEGRLEHQRSQLVHDTVIRPGAVPKGNPQRGLAPERAAFGEHVAEQEARGGAVVGYGGNA